MTLAVHVAAHPDQLVALLADRLAVVGDVPFAREVVAVPTRGIERWLTQRLAVELATRGAGDGICANVDFPSPGRLVQSALRAVPELAASADAWEGPALTAHVVEAVDEHLGEPWMRLLARHLAAGPGTGNRLAAAEKIARLFTGYARRRPAMVRAWAAGTDIGPTGSRLDEAYRWQPMLWRAVRARIAVPALAELLPEALAPLRDGDVVAGLPDRVSVYGMTAADPLDIAVLAALAGPHHVDLYLLHPSPELWRQASAATSVDGTPPRRAVDPALGLTAHPMLRSWAQDSRELQQVLAGYAISGEATEPPPRPETLLGTLQDDIARNRPPTRVAAADRSLQVHVCHGPRRQVEVARDAILHTLAADPTLQPRDVVIMTPDLATFAPLIEAAFPASGVATDHLGIPDLRVRIADRSPAAANPLVRFAATVLDLADGRLEAGAIRDLVGRTVVQQRFGFDADTAGAIDELVTEARIAWGLDGADRALWGAGDSATRTWRRGLDRALAGVFYADSSVRVVGDTVPLPGVEGQEARPVALLATLIDRVEAIRRMFATPIPRSAWASVVDTAVRMLAGTGWDEEWQWDQLKRLLAEAFPLTPGADPTIDIGEARRVLARWADDRPSPLHFRTGDVTVCTLVPMRSVPYRVVCLLGMDDGRFPRGSRADGDDLLVGDERVGDHDRAAEDRQLLIDAVMAAGDTLVVVYSGRDQRSNEEFPPAVPVSELVDVVADMLGVAELGAPVVTEHPLQSFSAANFEPGRLGVPGPWGFDPMQLAGAEAVQRRPVTPAPAPPVWPDPPEDEIIPLDRLVRLLENPAKAFLGTRVGVSVPPISDLRDDTVPADLSALEGWAVTDRLLAGLVAGHDVDRLVERERSNDAVPPGSLGADDLTRFTGDATALWSAAHERGHDPGAESPVAGTVTAAGRVVEGSVLADRGGGRLFLVTPSKVKGKHRLRSFAELLFVTAAAPETPWTSLLVGRRDPGIVVVTLGPVPGASADERRHGALERLGSLVELYVEGLRTALPLPCDTGYAWQRQLAGDPARAEGAARDAFEGRFGDGRDAHLALVSPEATSFTSLLNAGFEDYARRLWLPYLVMCREAGA